MKRQALENLCFNWKVGKRTMNKIVHRKYWKSYSNISITGQYETDHTGGASCDHQRNSRHKAYRCCCLLVSHELHAQYMDYVST